MKWVGRLLGSLVSLVLGLATIPIMVGTDFGGSLPGFLGLVAGMVCAGAGVGYTFTRLGSGSLRRSLAMGVLFSAPGLLLLNEFGGPAVLFPVVPLTFAAVVLGGRWASEGKWVRPPKVRS